MLRSSQVGLILVAVASFACADPTGPTMITTAETGRVIVDFGGSTLWPADRLVLDSVSVGHDTLLVTVAHQGGCRVHRYAAVSTSGWLHFDRVHVLINIAHDDGNDLCRAQVRPVLRFDLLPLQQAYRQSFGNRPAEIVLRVSELFPFDHGPQDVVYSWSE
jgi:hypothetical protein